MINEGIRQYIIVGRQLSKSEAILLGRRIGRREFQCTESAHSGVRSVLKIGALLKRCRHTNKPLLLL